MTYKQFHKVLITFMVVWLVFLVAFSVLKGLEEGWRAGLIEFCRPLIIFVIAYFIGYLTRSNKNGLFKSRKSHRHS
jgi:membrane protease YdiL (CAAX protease family)